MPKRAPAQVLNERIAAARPMLLRAGLLGLSIGLVIIGLMENVTRFSTPETFSRDARVAPSAQLAPDRPDEADAAQGVRADRLAIAVSLVDQSQISTR